MSQLRILASAFALGSPGGNQRSIQSWTRALADHDVVLVYRRFDDGPYGDFGPNVTLVPDWRVLRPRFSRPLSWWRAAALLTGPRGHFHAYLRFSNSLELTAGRGANVRAIMPAGDHLAGAEAGYDVALSQSEDGRRLLSDTSKHRVCLPPTYAIASSSEPVEGLPDRFVLTVFNPYAAVKGFDDLVACAAASPLPIVWAHRSRPGEAVDAPPGIIAVADASPDQLRWLYETCASYLSVSRSEGYGWAIADAILHGRPVISRRVGVLASLPTDAQGLHLFRDVTEATAILGRGEWESPDPDLIPPPSAASATLEALVADA